MNSQRIQNSNSAVTGVGGDTTSPVAECARLAAVERRSLLAEQARQLAHALRTPLSVIELICETLQIELGDAGDTATRLGHALGAVSKLSATLTETVDSNRFGDGPQQIVDVAAVAKRIVRLHGGDSAAPDAGAKHPGVLVNPESFEAAILHGLKLLAADGAAEAGACGHGRVLSCEHADGKLRLRLLARAPAPGRAIPPGERWLMTKAADRVARECGGEMRLERDSMTLILPTA